MRFVLSQSYDFKATRTPDPDDPTRLVKRPFSSVGADFIVQPLPPSHVSVPLQFRVGATVDAYSRGLTSLSTDLTALMADWRATVGTSHGQDGELQFVRGEVAAQLSRRWAARGSVQYDYLSRTVVENRLEVDFREQCWAASLALVDRVDEDEVRITINLLELGSFGFGRIFAQEAR